MPWTVSIKLRDPCEEFWTWKLEVMIYINVSLVEEALGHHLKRPLERKGLGFDETASLRFGHEIMCTCVHDIH